MWKVLPLIVLMAAPTLAAGQDRASELETRQAARAAALGQRSARLEGARGRDGWGAYADPCGRPLASVRQDGGYTNGYRAYRPNPYGNPYGYGIPGVRGYRSGCLPGQAHAGYPFDPFGYRWLPNPYDDWREIWGRGWLDGAEVPPYHRFQYRFFPETLPDPTRGGYVTPYTGGAMPPVGPVRPPAGPCARLRAVAPDGAEEVRVGLPLFGAATPEALRAVILDRLQRGGGVVVRSIDGYVFRFPPADAIRELTAAGC